NRRGRSAQPAESSTAASPRAAKQRVKSRFVLAFAAFTRSSSLTKPPFDRVEQSISDIDAELPIQFTYSRRARDVDLGEVVADHVEPGEEHAFLAQDRTDLRREPAVARRQRPAFAARAHREIAAALARRRHPRERILDRLAVDDEHALVAVDDLRHVALREREARAVAGQRLED